MEESLHYTQIDLYRCEETNKIGEPIIQPPDMRIYANKTTYEIINHIRSVWRISGTSNRQY